MKKDMSHSTVTCMKCACLLKHSLSSPSPQYCTPIALMHNMQCMITSFTTLPVGIIFRSQQGKYTQVRHYSQNPFEQMPLSSSVNVNIIKTF